MKSGLILLKNHVVILFSDLSYYTEQSTRTSLTTLALPQTPTDVVPAEQGREFLMIFTRVRII